MSKKKIIRNSSVYLLFLTNTVYAVKHGTSWLYWLSAALVGAMLSLDIGELVKHGRKK